MEKPLTVVVSDESILPEICGANDSNLKVLEELLGVRIFSRGNEILLDSTDDSIQKMFTLLLQQLEDHVRLGQLPGPDLIRSLHSSIASGEDEKVDVLKRNLVVIPNGLRKVYPRTYNQAVYLESIERNEISFGIGPAGTGKTYLAVAEALKQVLGQGRRKLIITRPVVEAGESLGFLPGDLTQKIHPYLRPLYDAIESLIPMEAFRRMEENGVIEIAPLAYMRGRTLSGAFIILDEAQNTTREQMKMFLTRIGENSRTVITGDITQIDLPRKSDSGLLTVIPILTPIREIRFTFFEERDVVRNPLVRKIVHAYETAHEE
ncbi:MAG: PhoH family protein [Spirochaetia bacterium]|jgi:phosphate starvation-inducible PhoH-like protein